MSRYICGLDISASKIALALAGLDNRLKVKETYFQDLPSRGFKNGAVVDVASLVDSVQQIINSAEIKADCKIREVCINFSSPRIKSRRSIAATSLAERTSKVITASDILAANNQAHLLGLKLDEEVLHEFSVGYRVDEQNKILNPLGLYGRKLESELLIVSIDTVSVENVKKVLDQAGLDAQCMVFDAVALSYAVLGPEDKFAGCILIDIGKEFTQILVFNAGALQDFTVLTFGSDAIDQALAQNLKITPELAEDLKNSYAQVLNTEIKDDDMVMVKRTGSYRPISRKLISSITEEKVRELLAKIGDKLGRLSGTDAVKRGIIFSGRTVLLEGFLEMTESILGLPVRMAQLTSGPLKDQALSLTHKKIATYLTVIGLVRFGIDSLHKKRPLPVLESGLLGRTLNRFKEIYQEYF